MAVGWSSGVWGYGWGSCWHFIMPWDNENILALLCMGVHPCRGHAYTVLMALEYLSW